MEDKKEQITFVCISDTHNRHRDIEIPKGDILIHAGDFTKFGKDDHAEDFNKWLSELNFAHKLLVVGNHECSNLKPPTKFQKVITNATFLWQQSHEVGPLKVFGTSFFWPFREEDTNPYFDQIPLDTNILITHGPPKGILDNGSGCPVLLKKIKELKHLKLVVFGHIHSGHGVVEQDGVTYVNAAICVGENYKLGFSPIVVSLNL